MYRYYQNEDVYEKKPDYSIIKNDRGIANFEFETKFLKFFRKISLAEQK